MPSFDRFEAPRRPSDRCSVPHMWGDAMGHGGHANQGAAAVYTPRGRQKGSPGGGGRAWKGGDGGGTLLVHYLLLAACGTRDALSASSAKRLFCSLNKIVLAVWFTCTEKAAHT